MTAFDVVDRVFRLVAIICAMVMLLAGRFDVAAVFLLLLVVLLLVDLTRPKESE